jgi:hypothetical protein
MNYNYLYNELYQRGGKYVHHQNEFFNNQGYYNTARDQQNISPINHENNSRSENVAENIKGNGLTNENKSMPQGIEKKPETDTKHQIQLKEPNPQGQTQKYKRPLPPKSGGLSTLKKRDKLGNTYSYHNTDHPDMSPVNNRKVFFPVTNKISGYHNQEERQPAGSRNPKVSKEWEAQHSRRIL